MNIALIGYGKMGHAIESIAIERGHNIALKITSANRSHLDKEHMQGIDVAIEFTNPEAALQNVIDCLATGTPVVCGSTGWNEELQEVKAHVLDIDGTFLHASNFSIGVNIFFEINKQLAALMNKNTGYEITIEETHHTQKKDAPSGTAITLATQVLDNVDRKKTWALNFMNNPDILPIVAHRVDSVPGTHSVKYASPIDDIEIIHTAHNRDGFALGAVLAAEFVAGKKGIFTMHDVLFSGQ